MKSFEASSTIAAAPDTIWAILTDGASFPSWDSGVDRVEGQIAPGETIKVSVKVNPGRTFPVKVPEFKPGQRMVWSGGMPLGLFRGVRTWCRCSGAPCPTWDHRLRNLPTVSSRGRRRDRASPLPGAQR